MDPQNFWPGSYLPTRQWDQWVNRVLFPSETDQEATRQWDQSSKEKLKQGDI
jgi:hypothetical protein